MCNRYTFLPHCLLFNGEYIDNFRNNNENEQKKKYVAEN